jgi:ATP-dependent exoDNAse (exonuclease V) beta subunit|tara:strand:+ start:618 stop:1379 length:762 start_codon:yes stop_codon:yes gene_type:complete
MNTYLQNLNKHERDLHISFDEGPHIYTIDGDSDFTSVTRWNHSHFPHFNADKIIKNMMKSHKWTENKYYGMSSHEIKALWRKNGKEASDAGTKMHFDIECFYNKQQVKNDSIEFQYFMDFHKATIDFKPYRTEWMVYDKELKMAGSIDMTFENEDGSIDIYDWKRSKEMKKTNAWESATTECINFMPNANFWHYSLQLNTYKAILEKNYGKKIRHMYLVKLHPNNPNKSYILYKVPNLDEYVSELFDLRKTTL